MYGGGSGTIAICGWQQVRLITRRVRLTWRGASARRSILRGWGALTCLILRYWLCFAGGSATWTAPPPTIAQPAAQADSFARAIRTDISVALFFRFPEAAHGVEYLQCPDALWHQKRREFLTGQWD